MSKSRRIKDPVEDIVSRALSKRGISYITEEENKKLVCDSSVLDFYLPEYRTWIECKQFYTERSDKQLSLHDDVILIQGKKAANTFSNLLLAQKSNDRASVQR